MVAIWPTDAAPGFPTTDGMLVTDDHMNQILDNLDDLNERAGTGNGTPLANRISTLETLTTNGGTTGFGNSTLSSRLGTGVTTANTATQQFTAITGRATALESAVGIPWSGGTALSRIQALEAGGVGAVPSGQWQAPATGKTTVSFGTSPSDTDVVMASVVKAPIGVSNSGGVITIGTGNAGWYLVEARYDLNMTQAGTQRVDCYFKNGAGATLGVDTRFYPGPGFGFHIWSSVLYLNAADTIKPGCKVWTTSGSGVYSVADDLATRTWLKIAQIGK